MKRNCKTCTLNTTNDTVETCKRMCYLRYSKQRNKRICDLEQEIQKLRQTLTEIKEIAKSEIDSKEFMAIQCMLNGSVDNKNKVLKQILQKISECEGNDEN